MPDQAALGRLVVLTGPSGAGKDTLIDGLRQHFAGEPRVLFVRRTITRPASAGGETHASLTEREFQAADQAGAFAVTWAANCNLYGWPAATHGHIAAGGIAIANGSRAALPAIRAAFYDPLIILIDVPEPELRRRLIARGRESPAEIEARLTRHRTMSVAEGKVLKVRNGGAVDEAVQALIRIVQTEIEKI